jgi:hypothetical protein
MAGMSRNQKQWAERVTAWRKSGLSSEEFSRGQEFTAGGLRYWASRVRRATASSGASGQSAETRIAAATSPRVRLARVVRRREPTRAAPAAPQATGLTVEVGRARISVGQHFDRDTLAAILELLGAGGER